jgi:O-antigen ligase/polysaccharide polymerase Wzy-like membrane protein
VKWIIFFVGLVGIVPLVGWLRTNRSKLPAVWTIVGALPLVMDALPKHEIALLGVPEWPGFSQGFEISLLDLFLVAVYFVLPRSRQKLPFRFAFSFYVAAVLLSALQAPNTAATLYYVWQLVRMFFAYVVVARACADPRLTTALLKGMAIGLCFQGGVVVWQRFVLHYLHVTGSFTTQNMLGLITHFVIFPFFALLLAGEKEWPARAIPGIGALIDVITASRASLGLAAAGFSILFMLSVVRKWTAQKARVLIAGFLVLALLSPLAYRQFELRLDAYGPLNEGGRSEMNNAAALILSEHPMGIGANNFVVVANVQGYYERANVGFQNTTTFPHNIYWTAAAETGYFGLFALMILLLRPLMFALACGWRYRNDRRGDLLLGLAVSFFIVYVHSYFEWVFFTDHVQYFFAIDLGIVAGLAEQLGYFGRTRHRLQNQALGSRDN